MRTLNLNAAIMKAPSALRYDIRCAAIVVVCGTIGLVVGFNTVLFNIGLFYGAVMLFLARYLHRRLIEKRHAIIDLYRAIAGVVIPSLTIVVLFLARNDAVDFCVGALLGVAFYNGLYLILRKASS